MKKLLLGTISALMMTGQAIASCNYNLDATSADYAMASVTPFPSINNTLQEGNKVIAAASGASNVALSHQFVANYLQSGDISVPSSGVFAIENYIVNFPSIVPQNGGVVNIGLSGVLSNTTEAINFSAYLISSNILTPNTSLEFSLYNVVTGQYVTQSYPVSLPIGSNFRTGLYVNQSTKQVGVIVNGVNKGYFPSIFQNPIQAVGFKPFSSINSSINTTDPVVGKTITTRLITDASSITGTYPSGAKDICGNTL